MEWYNILVLVLGAAGGLTGVVSIYTAKSNKQTIDISNMERMLESARVEREEMKQERELLKKDHQEYVKQVDERILMFKKEFATMKQENLALQEDVRNCINSIYQAYKCPYPEKIEDCPVMHSYLEKQEGNQ